MNINTNIYQTNKIRTRKSSLRSFGQNITNYEHMELEEKKKSRPKKIKEREKTQINEVSHYMDEITSYIKENQHESYLHDDYMPWHTDINKDMREVLVGWMISSHQKICQKSPTLYLSIHIVDKFCHSRNISKAKYQLLGAAALFVSAKYEEVKTPKIRNYQEICGGLYNTHEILAMENQILVALHFNIRHVSTHWHLEHKLQYLKITSELKQICFFLQDMVLVDYLFCFYKPTVLSCAIISFACAYKKHCLRPNQIIALFHICNIQFQKCLQEIESLFQRRKKSQFQNVMEKHLQTIGCFSEMI